MSKVSLSHHIGEPNVERSRHFVRQEESRIR